MVLILFQKLNSHMDLQRGNLGPCERFRKSQGKTYPWIKTQVFKIACKQPTSQSQSYLIRLLGRVSKLHGLPTVFK